MDNSSTLSSNNLNEEYKICILGEGAVGKTSLVK